MKRILILLNILLFMSGCSFINQPPRIFAGMEDSTPNGSPIFKTAWKSGCETGLKVAGNTHYKFVHKFDFNPDYIEIDEYNEAWYLGFDHCRWYVAAWQRKT